MKFFVLALIFSLFALFPVTLHAQQGNSTPTPARIHPNERIAQTCLSKSPLVNPATDQRFRWRENPSVADMEAHLTLLKGLQSVDSASWRVTREQAHNYRFLAPTEWEIINLYPGFLFNTPDGLADMEEVIFGGGDIEGFLDIISTYDRCVQSTLSQKNLDIDLYTFEIKPHGTGTQALLAFIVSYIPPGQSDFIIVGASYDSSLLSTMLEVMDSIQFEYTDWIQSV